MSTRKVIIPRDISVEELRGASLAGPVIAMEGATMGTYWRVQCSLPAERDRATIYNAIAESFELVVQQMSHFDSNSCLSKYNRAAPGVWSEIPCEFASVMRVALDVAARSDGAYDPTVGKLVDAYGFGANSPRPDDSVSIGAVSGLHTPGAWKSIALDARPHSSPNSPVVPAERTRFNLLQPGGIELNLSSIAKGYAVDLAAERLMQLGIRHFLIEIGGELRGHGCKPDGMPWWCLLEQPDGAHGLEQVVVALCGLAVATSGDLVQRRTSRAGERLSHLVDPRNGRPASDELALVTVFHESCCVADAWATALFVLGRERGLAMAQEVGLAALLTSRAAVGDESSAKEPSEVQWEEHWSAALSEMLD